MDLVLFFLNLSDLKSDVHHTAKLGACTNDAPFLAFVMPCNFTEN
jgi:hypothetical protein